MPANRLIYLHGFASSPGWNKARRFAEALSDRGVEIVIPDLNEGDFTGLTVSRQLALVERLCAGAPPASVLLVGSSMGGYVAALHAARSPRVAALVLMAPAFGFVGRWTGRMTPEALDQWRQRGSMQVFHYATEQLEPIGWSLVEDARQHPDYPEVTVPTLVFHGRHDESVPVACSERFADGRDNVTLEVLDSDHSLADAVEHIIASSLRFLGRWVPALAEGAPR